MFGGSRRHRVPNPPLTAATANPNAATAAASAFARQGSSTSLSAAAAAAALKARPTTPINVAEVQTKRTQRRTASVSSHGSQDARRPGLQRSPSTGSMTERTFRSPSPHRSSTAHTADVPPVPSIPGNVQPAQTTNGGTHRRATSLQMQPFRVASQKKKDGAGSWFGSAAEGNLANVRTSDAVLQNKPLEPRPGSISPSINFSYPRGPHASSPPTSPIAEMESSPRSQRFTSPRNTNSRPSSIASTDQSLVYDPNSRRMVPRSDLLLREQAVRDASEKPVKKKKSLGVGRSGSHLSKGTMGRTQGVAVEAKGVRQQKSPSPPTYVPTGVVASTSPQPRPQDGERTRKINTPPQTRQVISPVRTLEPEQPITRDIRATDGATILPKSVLEHPSPILGRKPSTVREEPEDETSDIDHRRYDRRQVTEALDAVPVKSSAVFQPPATTTNVAQVPIELPADHPIQSQPEAQNESSAPELRQYGSIRSGRDHSNSPVRSAHFGTATDQLAVRHEPPPRSVSPRKSALKHSSSPSRGASPSDDSSEASWMGRLAADSTVSQREDPTIPKKKSVRVSFDDQNTVVVGQAAPQPEAESPIVASPQARRPWYSNIGRSKKKDLLALDDDEVMKPRPALPSFGSVREKKTRETEERPLVRPVELENSPLVPASPATFPSTPENEDQDEILGQSSDQAIGALLSQEQTNRNAANISKFREPLPPVVTSLEGTGYYSPSTTSSEDEDEPETVFEPEPTLPPEQVKEEMLATSPEMPLNGSTKPHTGPDTENGIAREKGDIPSISISQPSPLPEKAFEAGHTYFGIPGGFPEDDSDDSLPPAVIAPQESRDDVKPAGGTLRDLPVTPTKQTLGGGHDTGLSLKPISHAAIAEESGSDDSGIYSDAYEDLSDVDGDGFMSLDAVLTTPISEKVSQKLFEKAMTSSSKESPVDSTARTSYPAEPIEPASEPAMPLGQDIPEDDWEKAKAYWRGLTNDKRRQLEKEAVEEAGVEADMEADQSTKKPKKKRKPAKEQPPLNPERVYQIMPGTKMLASEDEVPASSMRKTLRGPQGPSNEQTGTRLKKSLRSDQPMPAASSEVGMRKTLRSGPPAVAASREVGLQQTGRPESDRTPVVSTGMRKSMRQNGTHQGSGALQAPAATAKAERPLSLQQVPSDRAVLTKHTRNLSHDVPLLSSTTTNTTKPALRRRGSDSSESSFKRTRPRQEGFGFRSTMRSRQPPEPTPDASKGSGRFSLRSLSPPSSAFRRGAGVASPPPVSLRGSMRPTLRSDSSDGSTHRMRIPSFGRSSGKKAAAKSSKFSSRFGDSSDEDTAVPSTFRSRFADSSDEDEAPTQVSQVSTRPKSSASGFSSHAAAAAMHVPPPQAFDEKEEDSPELPDSSDEEDQQQPPRRTPSGRIARSQSDNIQGVQRKRSGRGGIIDSATSPALGTQALSDTRPDRGRRSSLMSVLRRKKEQGSGKITRPQFGESAARTDTKLERTANELAAIRVNSTSPRLQKRVESWPLPEPVDEEKRPATAGNSTPADENARPGFMKRRSTSQGLLSFGHQKNVVDTPAPEAEVVVEAGGKKKKKFGTLRRMFGLND